MEKQTNKKSVSDKKQTNKQTGRYKSIRTDQTHSLHTVLAREKQSFKGIHD